jgi:hypothetical protein
MNRRSARHVVGLSSPQAARSLLVLGLLSTAFGCGANGDLAADALPTSMLPAATDVASTVDLEPADPISMQEFEPPAPAGWERLTCASMDTASASQFVMCRYTSLRAGMTNWAGQAVPGQLFINLMEEEPPTGASETDGRQELLDRAIADAGERADERLVRRNIVAGHPAGVLEHRTATVVSSSILVAINARQVVDVRSSDASVEELERIALAVVQS